MWADILNHWKYLAGLFVYCFLLVLPIYFNINTLASSITTTSSQLVHWAWLYYVISTLGNSFFLYKSVHPYFIIVYLILIIIYGVWNPQKFLTTAIPMTPIFFITLFFMILLKLLKKDFLTMIFVVLLTITAQMALYSFVSKPTFMLLAVMALYAIGYTIFFKPVPAVSISAASTRIQGVVQPVISFFYNFTTLEKSGIFLLVSGCFLYLYMRTISKNYYGGQILVNDPISLNQVITFPIEATYHSSMSCWVYLNPSTRTEKNTIFLYGDQLLVSYEADVNSLRIRLKDDISYIERKALLQKWNHIAFVYDHGRIVLFLNGEVIHSSEWSPPSFSNELLFGKLQGKICNVRYYKEALEERFIESLYEDFKHKNPPIV